MRGEASALDHRARGLVLDDGQEIYSWLVAATGSAMRRPPLAGADEAYSIDTVHEAIAFDRRLAELVCGGADQTLAVVRRAYGVAARSVCE
jgi:NADH:quinone reductase (non-electrogenic)